MQSAELALCVPLSITLIIFWLVTADRPPFLVTLACASHFVLPGRPKDDDASLMTAHGNFDPQAEGPRTVNIETADE